ncbi:hypothetical protein BABINDRAFT_64885 [Babjeviella inositovora NRRL Y-12698]|uniref:U3 small nucleolar RNA-associated protein 22 n=1 Tax=Babjeviella inositovora NRRL Y-12698 TaxID=984486 RepID=A0A1E3QLL2_9ASCO|nr:uncharacterized protein BABINDRAFT_64885 [Babjeviella inositovora NRRL Y-12698]ODQ78354.1 hypothetical protein BABINDRAFT_64885 [Babjeviella inositovora NRRL Y-12698]
MVKRTTSEEVSGHVAKKPVTSLADLESEDGSESQEELEDIIDPQTQSENDEEDAADVEAPVKKKRPTRKQLAAQDIQAARETAELFKSNIFKLQIDELLKEVKLKESSVVLIEKALHRLYDLIQQIPEVSDLSLDAATGMFDSKKLTVPFADPKPAGKPNYRFGYAPPLDVSLVGSFGLKTAIKTKKAASIDVALTMPESLFQAKDYLNYRGLYKRSFYVAYVAQHLIRLSRTHNFPIKVSYAYHNDDLLNVGLLIESINTANADDLVFHKTHLTIQVLVAFPEGVFDGKKLMPDRNCVRIQVPSTDDTPADLPATPLYNASILTSTYYAHYLKFLYKNKKQTDQFKDAAMLAQIWLNQRGFTSLTLDLGFGSFEFMMLMAVLSQGGAGEDSSSKPVLMRGFSSYQLFKGAIKYLATTDLCHGNHLSFTSGAQGNIMAGTAYTIPQGNGTPTMVDTHTKLNILWKMTPASYQTLQNAATKTLTLLNEVVVDRFAAVFLERVSIDYLNHDAIIKLPVAHIETDSFSAVEKITHLTWEKFLLNRVSTLLSKALGDRVLGISVTLDKHQAVFPLTKRKGTVSSNNLVIGLNLNGTECDKVLTRGPDSEELEAASEFKQFWGEKVSLRRFKDGSIQHSIIWLGKKEPVVMNITKYVLDRHLQAEISEHLSSDWELWQSMLPVLLLAGANSSATALTTNLQPFHQCRAAMEQLVKAVSEIPETASSSLPLRVRSILPATGVNAKYTALVPPVPFAVSNPDFFQELILQFETTARWPDELVALEKTKTAFLLAIMDALHAEEMYKCYMHKDSTIPAFSEIYTLCILTPEGYGFKLRVLTERDEVLYLRAVANSEKQKPRLQECYLKFNETYMASIKHSRTLTTLATHYAYFPAVVRLFKKWLDSQMLLSHFTDSFVELIALKPFVDCAPFNVPCSVQNGLFRILHFLAQWNWREDPLILDLIRRGSAGEDDVENDAVLIKLSDKLTLQSVLVITANFAKIRQADPHGLKTQFFIGTKDDPSGILWSQNITLPIASRLTALARAAVQLISEQLAPLGKDVLKMLFTPAYQDYDFIIRCKTFNMAVGSGISPPGAFKNLLVGSNSYPEDLVTKFDPIQEYVKELQQKFGNLVVFSNHKYTGLSEDGENVVAGLFNPNLANGKKRFKVNIGFNIKPVEGKDEVAMNKKAILNEMVRLGGDLVVKVEMKK